MHKLTATDELRRLLDERGVEYETYVEQPTGFEHVKWNFGEHGSADFNLEFGEPWLTMYGVISGPEQAIAATLGPGTCHPVEQHLDMHSDLTVTVCSSCGVPEDELADMNFCPNCGARVEDE